MVQPLCERERLTLHIEVEALVHRLGISYKDAAHRLFLAEMEKMKTEERTAKSYANLRARIEESLAGCKGCFITQAVEFETRSIEGQDSSCNM